MNWFFNLVFLGTIYSAVVGVEEDISLSLYSVVIDSSFKESFEVASYRESFGDEEKPQDILSHRHHGFHPANSESWKLQCVWNAVNTVITNISSLPIVPQNNDYMEKFRKSCISHASKICGVDFDEKNCDPKLEYRSIDGTCNNIAHYRWGSATQPFERFVPSDYGNGISTLRRSENGSELPNPRIISRALSNSTIGRQPKVTLMLVHWGQFIDHDITLTPERETDRELKAKYTRHQGLVWDDSQCSYIGNFPGKSLVGCIIQCDDTPGCNAFIYKKGPGADCVLRKCSEPIPPPKVPIGSYLGYSQNTDPVDGSSTLECCNEGLYNNSVSLGDDCVPIDVRGDPWYVWDIGTQRPFRTRECLRFVRSMPASRGCKNLPMEQINRNTAFVDGSMVYGSDAEVADMVRTGKKGLLNTTMYEGIGRSLPPRGGKDFNHRCPQAESMDKCFLAGDVRVDEIPSLTALHTTFIRLHNNIADELLKINPHWCYNDEKIFQETRRIVIALIQQITYRDWLPHVVGQNLMNENKIVTNSQGYRDPYHKNVNPTIRNVFATAAFRFGHSLIANVIKAAKQVNDLQVPGNFFNINVIKNINTSPSSLLKGLTRCPSAPIDAFVEPAFTDSLFADKAHIDGNFYGLDLVSINIQRGRDHGIPGYIEWRRFCGLSVITDFDGLKGIMPVDLATSFAKIYQNVGDIDLFPAGLAENSIADGILGPTFSCIIARQFDLLEKGDRFWYERKDQPKHFTPDQLSSIRSMSLVSILCRVSKHTSFAFQPNPFFVATPSEQKSCSSYSFINLQPWKEIIMNGNQCGTRSLCSQSSNSLEASFGEFPWMAALIGGSSDEYLGGGALISNNVVLTAAHNVHKQIVLKIRVGDHNVATVQKIIIHPQFDNAKLRNDVALLYLSEPVNLNQRQFPHIGPVCLPEQGQLFSAQRCWLTGWNTNAFDSDHIQSVLNKYEVSILDNADCQQQPRETRLGPSFNLDQTFLCAISDSGKDTCNVDDGSPLVCEGTNGRFAVVGLLTWDIGCQSDTPSVYVNVANDVIFIKETTGI